jgi:hypothetical protein
MPQPPALTEPPPGSPGYTYGPPAYGPPGYSSPAPYYYYHHRYRPMPYGYPQPPIYSVAPPAPIESMEGFHTHDGLFLRVHLGIAATGFSSTIQGSKLSYSGGGSSMGIAVGGAVSRHLILYATVFGNNTANPNYQLNGASMATFVSDIKVAAVGPGLAYYFEQTNIYLSGAFGLAGYEMRDVNDGSRINWSSSGAALELMVGKEWWVSREWGLGIAAELFTASLKDALTPGATWSAGAASILFSATYN